MLRLLVAISLVVLAGEAPAAGVQLSPADEAAAFKAAGYLRKGKHWRGGCDDPGTASYMPPVIQTVRDLNGDGRPEAAIVSRSLWLADTLCATQTRCRCSGSSSRSCSPLSCWC
jgi:hypothetical protein